MHRVLHELVQSTILHWPWFANIGRLNNINCTRRLLWYYKHPLLAEVLVSDLRQDDFTFLFSFYANCYSLCMYIFRDHICCDISLIMFKKDSFLSCCDVINVCCHGFIVDSSLFYSSQLNCRWTRCDWDKTSNYFTLSRTFLTLALNISSSVERVNGFVFVGFFTN